MRLMRSANRFLPSLTSTMVPNWPATFIQPILRARRLRKAPRGSGVSRITLIGPNASPSALMMIQGYGPPAVTTHTPVVGAVVAADAASSLAWGSELGMGTPGLLEHLVEEMFRREPL